MATLSLVDIGRSGVITWLSRKGTEHDVRPILSRDDTDHHQESIGECGKVVV